jgi:hypothetical protein
MAKYEKMIHGNFDDIVDRLQNDIMDSALSMNLVDESNYHIGNTRIAVRVYDKYYMRNSNRASLSLTVAGYGNDIFISAIGAGGGQGVIFNFSLGAEDDMVSIVQESLEQMGYTD